MPTEPVIRLRDLRKRYGRHVALDGVDLELHGGQIVGVVGPDGAGKTTLMRVLAGLLEIEAAHAVVLGHDLRGDVTALKARIGYVPQLFSLNRDLSIFENLSFAARIHRFPATRFARRADTLLARTGLAPFADRAAGALSGGMKQKLAVAAALLVEPALLLLDEPTAGVDVVARGEIWDLLQAERERALVMISTSYLDETAACNRLVYLDRGRVVAVGTPADLEAAVPLDAYVAWADNPRAAAVAARQLPYVAGARVSGLMTRVEVHRSASPGRERVLADLRALPAVHVRLASAVRIDMETTLLALARGTA